jgi:uncharacterized phosphosugar-binding protein
LAGRGGAEGFIAAAGEVLRRLGESQLGAVKDASSVLARGLLAGGLVHVLGTGHSRIVARELAGRAGGLADIKELALDDLVLAGWASKAELLDGRLERRPEAAQALLEQAVVGDQDGFVVVSHTGCNGAPVEMALEARRRHLPVVAITSLERSQNAVSRHPSGQRLFEVADISIDICAPYADTVLEPQAGLYVCGVSTLAGVVVAQALAAEIVERYLEAGKVPTILPSRNLSR